jgi:hypothetical protein
VKIMTLFDRDRATIDIWSEFSIGVPRPLLQRRAIVTIQAASKELKLSRSSFSSSLASFTS